MGKKIVSDAGWCLAATNPQEYNEACIRQQAGSLPGAVPFSGFCYVCQQEVEFEFDDVPLEKMNWRETVRCPLCRLINRWRWSIHAFEEVASPGASDTIYLTEALGPLAEAFASHLDALVTSESVSDSSKPGEVVDHHGTLVRHEDVTDLSFADASLANILTFDVLEQVPNYERALH